MFPTLHNSLLGRDQGEWLASLISPPEAPMTADEAERAEMLNRRRQFMATLMDRPLTNETVATAKAADIFLG